MQSPPCPRQGGQPANPLPTGLTCCFPMNISACPSLQQRAHFCSVLRCLQIPDGASPHGPASVPQVSPHPSNLAGAGGEGTLGFGSGVSSAGWSQRRVGAASWLWTPQGLTCTPRSWPSPQASPGLQQLVCVLESKSPRLQRTLSGGASEHVAIDGDSAVCCLNPLPNPPGV